MVGVKDILLIILIIILSALLFLIVKDPFNQITPIKQEIAQKIYENKTIAPPPSIDSLDNFSNINYPHWGHMPLTYFIENESECKREVEKIDDAFFRIQNETDGIVRFEKVYDNSSDITIRCQLIDYDAYGDYESVTLGEALPYVYVANQNLIASVEINLFHRGGENRYVSICATGYPALEVHEILHGFGFAHIGNTDFVMTPYSAETSRDCKTTELDEYLVQELKTTYSNTKYLAHDVARELIYSNYTKKFE